MLRCVASRRRRMDKWIEEEKSMMRENQISPLPSDLRPKEIGRKDGMGGEGEGEAHESHSHAVANPKLRSLQRKIGGERRGGTVRRERVDRRQRSRSDMLVGRTELSFNMEYRLENRYSYTNERREESEGVSE